jgi:aldose sugar dehydrogenase
MAYQSSVTPASVRWLIFIVMLSVVAAAFAQQQAPRPGISVAPLGNGPFVFDTGEQHKIRVAVVTKGLSHPWSMAFLPDGNMLITERAGRLRVLRDGVLDPNPVAGLPAVRAQGLAGLMDIALHPRFSENKLVYFTYHKAGANNAAPAATPANNAGVITLARGRWDGAALVDVKDIFSSIPDNNASRMVFGKDGMVYMSIGTADPPNAARAQDPNDLAGKVLRLKDDGTVPSDNPFVGRSGYRPEIFTMGHRNPLGLTVHPVTGAIWENEDGPNGGDEINILLPGKNYGWPVVSNGRFYAGPRVTEKPWQEDMENPLVFWVPSIAISGITFYTGDQFPNWKGNVFVGGMRQGEIPGTGQMQRIVFNNNTEELRREPMLVELHQRIRDIRQGPNGLLYVLTEENEAALLRIEPAP